MNDITIALNSAKNYYENNNLPVPTSVVEYIKSYPKGLSRQVLSSTYGLKCSEFVKLLNPSYVKPLNASERATQEALRLEYTIKSDLSLLTSNKDKVTLQCKNCEHIHITSIISLIGTKLGCPKCKSGNLPWHLRKEELEYLLYKNFGVELESSIPKDQTGLITLKHIECGTIYTNTLVGMVSPQSNLRGTCPNCRSTDRRVTLNGITFGSQFEADCYNLLKPLNPELHVKYSDYFSTNRYWVCDFKIRDYWIEVSNFKVDYKGYFSNIVDKENLVESNGKIFLFIRSLKELKEIISLM